MILSQQGSARAPQKYDLEEKLWRYVVGLPWQSCVSKTLNTSSIYRREGGEEAASNPQGLAEIGGGGVLLQSYLE